ncbi:hypothetical protein BG005_004732 [Podila minutissima]|nr:hypothetical protein BG005_004732 [Podila minutissima]
MSHGMTTLSENDPDASSHVQFMKLAIDQANLSIPVQSGYCVGAVLVQLDPHRTNPEDRFRILATGYSRELLGNTHAEECCLLKLAQLPQSGQHDHPQGAEYEDMSTPHPSKELVMYSTMEPCSTRLSGNRPCSDRLIESGVRTVYVGVREPDHFVQKVVGVENMVEQGMRVVHIPGYEAECLAPNRHVL